MRRRPKARGNPELYITDSRPDCSPLLTTSGYKPQPTGQCAAADPTGSAADATRSLPGIPGIRADFPYRADIHGTRKDH